MGSFAIFGANTHDDVIAAEWTYDTVLAQGTAPYSKLEQAQRGAGGMARADSVDAAGASVGRANQALRLRYTRAVDAKRPSLLHWARWDVAPGLPRGRRRLRLYRRLAVHARDGDGRLRAESMVLFSISRLPLGATLR